MDPNEALKEMLDLANSLQKPAPINDLDALMLAGHVKHLDAWIRGGGFLPEAWEKKT